MDRHARDALIRHLITMYDEGDRLAVVRVDEFFTGNTDEHSIGVNLAPSEHVGLAAFRRVLLDEVSRRPDVSSVYIEFAQVPDPDEELDADEWPTASVCLHCDDRNRRRREGVDARTAAAGCRRGMVREPRRADP